MSRRIFAGATVAFACLLSACGSATVENDGTPEATSVPPLERSSSATSSSTASTSASANASVEESGEPAIEDQGAREVSEIPTSEPPIGEDAAGYLRALGEAGLNTEGVEDQLIGAGHSACHPEDAVTIPAVSGQLIEQQRTTLSYEELSTLIEDQARTAFC